MPIEPSRRARELLADAIADRGPGWRSAADSIRCGGYGNAWTEAALVAIDEAYKQGQDDGAD